MNGIKIYSLILFFLLSTYTLLGGDIHVKTELQALPSDISAQQYPRTDKNDDTCALIKVRTHIKDMHFDSRLGITGSIEYKNGEYWIYLSYGERMLQLMHESATRLDYLLPVPVESDRVYLLVIDGDVATKTPDQPDLNGQLSILSSPYESLGATIKINGKETEKTTPAMISLHEGVYSITLEKQEYEHAQRSVVVHAGENLQVAFDMEKIDPLKQYRKQLKTQRAISGILSLVSLGSGIYCTIQGNQAYHDYQRSTNPDDISNFKKRSNRMDVGAMVSYSVSLGSLVWFCTTVVKGNKVKQK